MLSIKSVLSNAARLLSMVKGYKPLSETKHSELRASENTTKMSTVDFNTNERSSLDLSVGYFFTDSRRRNKLRGRHSYSSTERFVDIYEYLTTMNGGVPFIETYFDTLFKHQFESIVRKKTRELLSAIDQEYQDIMSGQKKTKSGAFDRRTKAYKRLVDFKAWKNEKITSGFDFISLQIKRHIKYCLASGRIPLNFFHSGSTIDRRKKIGLTPVRAFFATGQLIDNLVISYEADWRAS